MAFYFYCKWFSLSDQASSFTHQTNLYASHWFSSLIYFLSLHTALFLSLCIDISLFKLKISPLYGSLFTFIVRERKAPYYPSSFFFSGGKTCRHLFFLFFPDQRQPLVIFFFFLLSQTNIALGNPQNDVVLAAFFLSPFLIIILFYFFYP